MQTISLSQLIEELNSYEFFVVDRKVYNLHLKNKLENKKVYFIDEPEQNKSLAIFSSASDYFIEAGMKRNDKLVCIGGGATTDLGGFVASSLFRGVNWIAVPTTLLGMIDASIGGKVGVNTKHGKNLIGHFHKPLKEYICLKFLESLDHRQIDSGKGEMLKYAFLSSEINEQLEQGCGYLNMIHKCAEFKKNIVEKDFKEKGLRVILNYGHTFGHAFEKQCGMEHGMAVAVGIQLNIELFAKELKTHLNKLLTTMELNLEHNKIKLVDFIDTLMFDKKNTGINTANFVVVDPIGKTRLLSLDKDELRNKIIKSDVYDRYFL